jgi:hypothetical protein
MGASQYNIANHKATAASQYFAAAFRPIMCDDNAVEDCGFGVRQINWKRYGALAIPKKGIRMLLYPTLRAEHLIGGVQDRFLKPTTPVLLQISRVFKLAIFVAKDEDVVFENN